MSDDAAASASIPVLPTKAPWHIGFAIPGLVLLVLLAFRQVSSSDIGFHLKAGTYVLQGNGWPRIDPFTYTVSDHPYVWSWGYQVLVALADRLGGTCGIVIFHELLLLATFILVWRTALLIGGDAITAGIFLVPGVVACEMRFEARPEILSILLLVMVICFLTRYTQGKSSSLGLLPLVFLAWVNCHSYFVLGWGALAAFLIGRRISSGRFDRRLGAVSLACVAICLVNPYGIRGVLFPFSLLTRFSSANLFSTAIGEFMSPFALRQMDQAGFYPFAAIWAFRILTVLSLYSAAALIRARRYDHAILWFMFALVGTRMIRNMPIFVAVALPGIVWAYSIPFRSLLSGFFRPSAFGLAALTAACLSGRTITNAYYLDDRRLQRFGCAWNILEQPVAAAANVRRSGLHGPMFNHMNIGEFWMWAQDDPVFIDGRLELFGEAFYAEYFEILKNEDAFVRADRRYGFNYIVVPFGSAQRFTVRMFEDPKWRVAYYDNLVVIFVRRGTAAAQGIDLDLEPLSKPNPPDLLTLPGFGRVPREKGFSHWVSGLTRTAPDPTELSARGVFHLLHGDLEIAEGEFAKSIEVSRGAHYEAYRNLGAVLWRLNRKDEAKVCYRIVLEEVPDDRLAQERVGEP